MKKTTAKPLIFTSISSLMREIGMPTPLHPLVALVNYDKDQINLAHAGQTFLIDFYKISFRRNFKGQVKYGQGYYDFEEGGLSFLAPNQLVIMSGDESSYEGYTLYFHADLIRNYQLGKKMPHYGFFSYAINEALFLSEKEKKVIISLFNSISTELENNIDAFSQDILVSLLELLLNHSNRFYNRQFLTRKTIHHDLIADMDAYLSKHFESETATFTSLPSVKDVANHLKVSSRYLTDILKSLTGQSAQQHIHTVLVEKAKSFLSTSQLSIGEIAYQLGFEHPQSFNKLFKRIALVTPNAFRQSFN